MIRRLGVLASFGFAMIACGASPTNTTQAEADPAATTSEALCVDNVFCIAGTKWDSKACACVPVKSHPAPECRTASDCTGILPMICEICPNGKQECAHFECAAHKCEVVTCK